MSFFNGFPFTSYKFGNETDVAYIQDISAYVDIIDQVKELMLCNEIEIDFGISYFRDAACRASKSGMGARAVKSIVENSLFYLMYNAPELQEEGVIKVIFDKYPSRIEKPMAMYADGTSRILEDYRFFRNNTLDNAK